MKVVMPLRAEFGHRVHWHAPAVHALKPDAIYIEPGDEALYPSAAEYVYVPTNDDALRRNHYRHDTDLVKWAEADARERWPGCECVYVEADWPKERFTPQPRVSFGIECDVVVAPRKREYGATRNWDAWPDLVDALTAAGLRVFAVGAKETCYDVDCPAAWDYGRHGDASIEAMLDADLVVATDSGNAHLAVLCGRPLLVVTYRGRVGPGPVMDQHGTAMEDAYGPCRVDRYVTANHTNARIDFIDGWERPEKVVERALKGGLVTC